jgi:hypothetical protein
MDRASVEAAFGATPTITCGWSWSSGDTIATCSHAAALAADTTYAVTLSTAAKDATATPLPAPHSFTFTTAVVDLTPPTVSGTAPADLALGVPAATSIAVTFSEPVNQGSAQGAFSIQGPAGHDAGTFSWSTDGRTMTFQPDVPFAPGDSVAVRVTTAVTDVAGNAMAANVDFSFKVLRVGTVTLCSDAPLDGVLWSGDSTVYTLAPSLYVGDSAMYGYGRAFVSFDLGQLPASATAISGATLSLYQESGANAGAPYVTLGVLHAERVDYGSALDSTDLLLPALDGATYTLSTTAATEWKQVGVSPSIANAWADRVMLASRAQFRLRFATNTDGDGASDTAAFASGNTLVPANCPSLTVEYLYP